MRNFTMKKMNNEQRKEIEILINQIMTNAISSDYVRHILEHENEKGKTFIDDVIDDVMCASAWEDEGYYNEDDIRLAIGRVFEERLDIQY